MGLGPPRFPEHDLFAYLVILTVISVLLTIVLDVADRLYTSLGTALTATLLLAFGRGAATYRISIGSLALSIAMGIFFLLRVPDARPHGRGVRARGAARGASEGTRHMRAGAAEIRRREEREKWEYEGI